MRKVLLAIFICTVLLPTGPTQADPVQVDQYGGHECTTQCEELWDLGYNQYHYHVIPETPDYYRGEGVNPLRAMLEPTTATLTQPTTFLEPNNLIQNPALDVSYCLDATLFAQGWYDENGAVRIPPVCEAFTPKVLNSGYATLPLSEGYPQTKAYKWRRDYLGNAYFSDLIPIKELKGMVIQGHTDTAQYVVMSQGGGYSLVKVAEGHFATMKDNVIRLDDSLVYSYPIKR